MCASYRTCCRSLPRPLCSVCLWILTCLRMSHGAVIAGECAPLLASSDPLEETKHLPRVTHARGGAPRSVGPDLAVATLSCGERNEQAEVPSSFRTLPPRRICMLDFPRASLDAYGNRLGQDAQAYALGHEYLVKLA